MATETEKSTPLQTFSIFFLAALIAVYPAFFPPSRFIYLGKIGQAGLVFASMLLVLPILLSPQLRWSPKQTTVAAATSVFISSFLIIMDGAIRFAAFTGEWFVPVILTIIACIFVSRSAAPPTREREPSPTNTSHMAVSNAVPFNESASHVRSTPDRDATT